MLFWRNSRDAHEPVFSTDGRAWAQNIRRNWKVIRAELRAWEADRVKHHARVPGHWSRREGWGQVILTHGGLVSTQNALRFPATTDLVLGWGVPIESAWFSVLEPGRHLTVHEGEYKGMLRYHLGLEVPAMLPVRSQLLHSNTNTAVVSPAEVRENWVFAERGARAHGGSRCWSSPAHLAVFSHSRDPGTGLRARGPDGGRPSTDADEANCLVWAAGTDIAFDDSFLHYVVNDSPSQRRVVLFVDFLRTDVPPWLALLNRFLLYYFLPTLQTLLYAATRDANFGFIVNPLPGSPPWFMYGRFFAAHIVGVVVCLCVLRASVGHTARICRYAKGSSSYQARRKQRV